MRGRPGVGSPAGTSPTTRIPLASSEKTATTAVASQHRDQRARQPRRQPGERPAAATSTAAAKATVGQCTASQARDE